MKHYRLTSTHKGDTFPKLAGGGKFSSYALLRHSLILPFFVMIVSFLCLACSKETSRMSYPEMLAYYAESCNLGVAATDSVTNYTNFFNLYTASPTR